MWWDYTVRLRGVRARPMPERPSDGSRPTSSEGSKQPFDGRPRDVPRRTPLLARQVRAASLPVPDALLLHPARLASGSGCGDRHDLAVLRRGRRITPVDRLPLAGEIPDAPPGSGPVLSSSCRCAGNGYFACHAGNAGSNPVAGSGRCRPAAQDSYVSVADSDLCTPRWKPPTSGDLGGGFPFRRGGCGTAGGRRGGLPRRGSAGGRRDGLPRRGSALAPSATDRVRAGRGGCRFPAARAPWVRPCRGRPRGAPCRPAPG